MADPPRFVHFRSQYENKYLGAWNLIDGAGKRLEVSVKIDRWQIVEMVVEGGRKERKPVLFFVGTKSGLPLVLSARLGKEIDSLYGPNMNDWIGKIVTLFPERRMAFGRMHDVISIRGKSRGAASIKSKLDRAIAPHEDFPDAAPVADVPEEDPNQEIPEEER